MIPKLSYSLSTGRKDQSGPQKKENGNLNVSGLRMLIADGAELQGTHRPGGDGAELQGTHRPGEDGAELQGSHCSEP